MENNKDLFFLNSEGRPAYLVILGNIRTGYSVEAELFEITSWNLNGEPDLEMDTQSGPKLVALLDRRWDGCFNLKISSEDDGMVHGCGVQDFEELLWAIKWAWEQVSHQTNIDEVCK